MKRIAVLAFIAFSGSALAQLQPAEPSSAPGQFIAYLFKKSQTTVTECSDRILKALAIEEEEFASANCGLFSREKDLLTAEYDFYAADSVPEPAYLVMPWEEKARGLYRGYLLGE